MKFPALLSFVLVLFAPVSGWPGEWISALDEERVKRAGSWRDDRFRYAATASLASLEDKAALEMSFSGTGIAIRLGGHNVPSYGSPNLGLLIASIDGTIVKTIRPRGEPRELVLADGLDSGEHRLRIEHRVDEGGLAGCRVEGFRTWKGPRGVLRFQVNGEENEFLVDVRAILRRGSKEVRNLLVRNWMTGQASMTGLEPSAHYSLEVLASGWQSVRVDSLAIGEEEETVIPPIYLRRDESTVISRFRYPALNRQAIRRPGESFRARFLGYDASIDEVRLIRRIGPAVISRALEFEEDEAAAHYYDREVVAKLPADMPPGLYDLSVQITGGRRTGFCKSPRSVHVVKDWPRDPVLVTFGHLDTSAQFQAEYLERIAEMANLLGADFVLQSNAVNPAYISGALARLEMPYVTHFGNHQFPGHEAWYGDPVGRIDFGPDISILNFGHLWFEDLSKAEALFEARTGAKIKIINAFEANAPVEFLNRHQVRLIHDAHGLGRKVMNIGTTPTVRVGKVNAVSFRVVRFKDSRVVSATYHGHETAPIPFARDEESPLHIEHGAPSDGTTANITTVVKNALKDPYPNGRVTWVLPRGTYRVKGGRFESSIDSDDGRYSVVSARVDIPADGNVQISVMPGR